MKKVLICSVAALVILLAGNTALTRERNRSEGRNRENARKTNKISEQDRQWREKLKSMTPEQRRIAMAQKNFDTELAPWQQVRKIAAGENAVKTIAAIDKIIADKQSLLKKRLEALNRKKPANEDKTRERGNRQEGRRTRRNKDVN